MKKYYILIGTIALLFIMFIITIFIPKNYTLNYQVNGIKIQEEYNKKDKHYQFIISYKDVNYPLLINKKYQRTRKLISNISINQEEQVVCLNIYTKGDNYIVCSENGSLKDLYTLSENFLEKSYNISLSENQKIDEYNNIEIYNLDNNYYIWNYKGFYHLNSNIKENLEIFKKDNYLNELSYQTSKYLIIPNYDSDYYFKKLYIYNIAKNNYEIIEFTNEISYDSIFLGEVNNKLYLLDKKNKNEYEINLKKNKIKKISKDGMGTFYNGSTFEDLSITKLINNNEVFPIENVYKYTAKDGLLYLSISDYDIQISNRVVKKIVYQDGSKIYYLSDNALYSYEYMAGEKLLLKYNEWNFNYNNHIFIFN